MKNLSKLITLVLAFGIFSICFCAKIEAAEWDEYILRMSVQSTIDVQLSKVIQRDRDRKIAYAELCKLRIRLLKRISKNELFLPVDVWEYIHQGYVRPTSYEARMLEEVAGTSHHKETWKPVICKLIKAYKSIKSLYRN